MVDEEPPYGADGALDAGVEEKLVAEVLREETDATGFVGEGKFKGEGTDADEEGVAGSPGCADGGENGSELV